MIIKPLSLEFSVKYKVTMWLNTHEYKYIKDQTSYGAQICWTPIPPLVMLKEGQVRQQVR